MSAVHEWSESNGAGESITDSISNINFGSVDSPNLTPVSNKITAGENSFEKYLRCKFTGTFTEISNMKFWKSAGTYKTGEDIKAAANQTYAQPVSTTSAKATVTVPITEGGALSIESAEGDPTIIYGASGVSGYTGYIVLQLQSTIALVAGAVNQKTFTFQYDES